jgi:hypothetical protein
MKQQSRGTNGHCKTVSISKTQRKGGGEASGNSNTEGCR